MTDTHASIERRFRRMMMGRAPLERLKMGCSMFDSAKRIVRSSILNQNPRLSAKEIKRAVFLRFYGQDFGREQQIKILNSLHLTPNT